MEPLKPFLSFFVDAPAFFVLPVSGNASFGGEVHFLGSDLNFNALTAGADDGGVKALIIISFRHGNKIFKAAGNGLP